MRSLLKTRESSESALVRFSGEELDLSWKSYVPILLTLSWAASCIDIFSLPSLRIFVANNTGNLILLALAVGQLKALYPDIIRPVPCIVSLCASWAGSYVSGYVGRRCGSRSRGYLFGEFCVQALATFLCAGLYYGKSIKFLDDRTEYITISLMSFTMGQQNVVVKAMKVGPTILTTVATGSMADLFSDPELFAPLTKNRPRNERAAFILTFFFGGAIGAVAFRYSSPQLSLLMTAILKMIAAFSFLVVPAKRNSPPPVRPKTLESENKTPAVATGTTQSVGKVSV